MKFYKLELINREQSYNQMFGTAPSVGGLMTANVMGQKQGAKVVMNPAGINSKKIL